MPKCCLSNLVRDLQAKAFEKTQNAKRDKCWDGHLATSDPSFLKFGENLEAKALKKMLVKTKRAARDKGWDGLYY